MAEHDDDTDDTDDGGPVAENSPDYVHQRSHQLFDVIHARLVASPPEQRQQVYRAAELAALIAIVEAVIGRDLMQKLAASTTVIATHLVEVALTNTVPTNTTRH